MVAVKAGDADAFLARPDPAVFCVLVYGPDAGLVNERAAALVRSAVDDPADPFALVRLDGDDVASDPPRLLDEAHTVPLFGGRRAIWLRLGSRAVVSAVEQLLAGPRPEARVVIEAGDLKKSAPLRTLCERSRSAAALPCFADTGAALGRVVDQELAAAGLSIDREARAALVELLGGDRLATRQELGKLALYAASAGRVSLADIHAVIADGSALTLDDIVDAAFGGDSAALERDLVTLGATGMPASVALTAALGHALRLHRLRAEVEGGARPAAALDKGWPMLHFRRRQAVEQALARWPLASLADAVRRLGEAIGDGRRCYVLSEPIARRALALIADEARRRA